MSGLNALFHREYDEDNYNCAHLVCEAWEKITGHDISVYLSGMLEALEYRSVDTEKRHYFRRTIKPVSPCIVQMRNKGQVPHVGIYVDGFVMQITQQGVQNQPLEISTRGYKLIKFYRNKQ